MTSTYFEHGYLQAASHSMLTPSPAMKYRHHLNICSTDSCLRPYHSRQTHREPSWKKETGKERERVEKKRNNAEQKEAEERASSDRKREQKMGMNESVCICRALPHSLLKDRKLIRCMWEIPGWTMKSALPSKCRDDYQWRQTGIERQKVAASEGNEKMSRGISAISVSGGTQVVGSIKRGSIAGSL
jgi:hypothetical protein